MSEHNKDNNDNASDSKLTEQDLATISSRIEKIEEAVKASASIAADTTSNAIQKMQETLETMFEKMLSDTQSQSQQESKMSGQPPAVTPMGQSQPIKQEFSWTDEDVKVICRPSQSQDATSKSDIIKLEALLKTKRQNIPILNDTTGDDGFTSHNYEKWKSQLLSYIRLTHPSLHEWLVLAFADFDMDKYIKDPEGKLPVLPTELVKSIADLDKLIISQTIFDTVNKGSYNFLIDNRTLPQDFVTIYGKVYVHFEPNTLDNRNTLFQEFFEKKLPPTSTIEKYAAYLRKLADTVNLLFHKEMISEGLVVAHLRKSVRESDRFPAYNTALVNSRGILNVNQFVNYLRANLDASLLPSPTPHQPSQLVASMARTRGGKGGERGRGGGRGGKGGNNRPWRNSYITGTDEKGDLVVGREIKDNTSKLPCFNMFTKKRCSRDPCPYNHQFNVIDTSRPGNQPLMIENKEASITNSNSSNMATISSAQQQQQLPEQPDQYDTESYYDQTPEGEEDDGFFTAHFAGFAGQDNKQDVNLLTMLFHIFMFFLSPVSFTCVSLKLFLSVSCSFIHSCLLSIVKFIYDMTLLFSYVSINIFCFITIPFSTCMSKYEHCAFMSLPTFIARMPVYLDSGCSTHMTGDSSLFVQSTMVPHVSKIKLADSKSAQSTHMGKINVRGQLLDCLYVPDFTQTLLSLGQFLNSGMTIHTDIAGNIIIRQISSPTNYLQFNLSHSNLLNLDLSTQTHTA